MEIYNELFISKRDIGLDRKFTHCLYRDNGSLSFPKRAQSGHEGFPGDEERADDRYFWSNFSAHWLFYQDSFCYIITQVYI